MSDLLTRHALANVWCTPEQDRQFIFKPCRISSKFGVKSMITVGWQQLLLPNIIDKFHVFQIGQINPNFLGLRATDKTWTSGADIVNLQSVLVEVYNNHGFMYPRGELWFRWTGDKNLIIAIRDIGSIWDVATVQPYIRLYSNAFFETDRSSGNVNALYVAHRKLLTADDKSWIVGEYDWYSWSGTVLAYRNGRLVDSILPNNVNLGDVVEIVYDSTIKAIVEYPINGTPVYESTLDSKRKYLLHRPKPQPVTQNGVIYEASPMVIDYKDDVDFYLMTTTLSSQEGFYYHKNQEDAVRMVTHRDYALPVAYVAGFLRGEPGWRNVSNLKIRAYIRSAGYHRQLVFESNRINYLYRLNDQQILQAMTGINSSLENWNAATLESSQYVALMSAKSADITTSRVRDSYGYHAMARLLGTSMLRVDWVGGTKQVELPYNLQTNSTIFEYDANGLLLDFYQHIDGVNYVAQNQWDCQYIEGCVGLGGKELSTDYDSISTPVSDLYSQKCYVSPVSNNQPTNEWTPAREGIDFKYNNSMIEWSISKVSYRGAVKTDDKFLAYTTVFPDAAKLIRFSVVAIEEVGGVVTERPHHIPFAQLDVWLNGRSLIANLDYYVRWPEVVIYNKKYRVAGDQTVTIRAMGLGSAVEQPDDVGFVQHGMFSVNSTYNIREDRNVRIVVDGQLKHQSQLGWVERYGTMTLPTMVNGTPYSVRDHITPLREFYGTNTYELRAASRAVDEKISNYLKLRIPEAQIPGISAIPDQYMIYSPWTNKIIHDLLSGVLNPSINRIYTDLELESWLKHYEWLLDYDPVRTGVVDTRYVSIHPHDSLDVVTLSAPQHVFVQRAINFYLDGAVDLTAHVQIV